MDLEEIFKNNEKIFDQIDNGIKKIMVVIYNEEINLENKYIVSHSLKNIDIEYNNKIQFILFSRKNYLKNNEKDEFFVENEEKGYSIFKNYFYVENYTFLPNLTDNFLRKIMFSPVVVDCDSKILNDFYPNKKYIYEFNCPNNKSNSLNVYFENNEKHFDYKISSTLYSIEKNDIKYVKKGDNELYNFGEEENQFYIEFENYGNEILTQFEFYLNKKNKMPKYLKIIIIVYILLMITIIFFLTNFGRARKKTI
jgi:hypothetical protein